jgi:putative phosphoesterase
VRVAALSDVHGNLPALEAVLADVAREAPDLIVVCGDVAEGPLPAETIDLLLGLSDVRFVRGNTDREIVEAFDGPEPAVDWCATEITDRQRDFLASFEDTVRLELDGFGPALFCHGSPRRDDEMLGLATPPELLRERLEGTDAALVVCGHTHMQFDRIADGIRVVNPGSVGMPYAERPGAYWSLLGPDVEHRRTEYDLGAAAARLRRSSWPTADAFVRENVLAVPTVDEALAAFSARGEM